MRRFRFPRGSVRGLGARGRLGWVRVAGTVATRRGGVRRGPIAGPTPGFGVGPPVRRRVPAGSGDSGHRSAGRARRGTGGGRGRVRGAGRRMPVVWAAGRAVRGPVGSGPRVVAIRCSGRPCRAVPFRCFGLGVGRRARWFSQIGGWPGVRRPGLVVRATGRRSATGLGGPDRLRGPTTGPGGSGDRQVVRPPGRAAGRWTRRLGCWARWSGRWARRLGCWARWSGRWARRLAAWARSPVVRPGGRAAGSVLRTLGLVVGLLGPAARLSGPVVGLLGSTVGSLGSTVGPLGWVVRLLGSAVGCLGPATRSSGPVVGSPGPVVRSSGPAGSVAAGGRRHRMPRRLRWWAPRSGPPPQPASRSSQPRFSHRPTPVGHRTTPPYPVRSAPGDHPALPHLPHLRTAAHTPCVTSGPAHCPPGGAGTVHVARAASPRSPEGLHP